MEYKEGRSRLDLPSLVRPVGLCSLLEFLKIVIIFLWNSVNGALDRGGGSPMSHVDFKKRQCPLSLFLQFPYRF